MITKIMALNQRKKIALVFCIILLIGGIYLVVNRKMSAQTFATITNQVNATYTDSLGNQASTVSNLDQTVLTDDSIEPTGSIAINNGTSSTTNSTVVINVTASDSDSGLSTMRFSNDGSNWADWVSFNSVHPDWDLTNLRYGGNRNGGTKNVYAQVRDNIGNTYSFSDSISYTAPNDTGRPEVKITAPAAYATLSGTVDVSANAIDNVGVTKVEFRIGSTLIGTDTTAPYSVSFNTAGKPNGSNYMISATAYDVANNSSYASNITVTITN